MKKLIILLLAVVMTSCNTINNIQCRTTIKSMDKHLYKAHEKKIRGYMLGCITGEDTNSIKITTEEIIPRIIQGEVIFAKCDSLNEVIFYLQDSLGFLKQIENKETIRTIYKYIEKNGEKLAQIEVKDIETEDKIITNEITHKPNISVTPNSSPNHNWHFFFGGAFLFSLLFLLAMVFKKRMAA
jgi:hypothetical protein